MQVRKPKILVTAVGSPPGLNTLRALVETGTHDLIAADADKYSPALYKYNIEHVVLRKASNGERYIEDLKNVIAQKNVSVLIPCIEDEIFIIAKYRDQLITSGVKFLVPDTAILEKSCNKGRSTALAAEHGIACPNSIVIKSGLDPEMRSRSIREFMKTCPFPWIIKPVIGHGMNGVVRIQSQEEAYNTLLSVNEEVVVQEVIPGKIGSMYLAGLLYDEKGDLKRSFSSRSIRTLYASGGPATGGVSVLEPDLIRQTEKLLGVMGRWKGPAAVEWMLDPRDNEFKFIEINPRFWGYSYLAVGAGANLHSLYVDLALGRSIGPDPGFKVGTVMLRATEDLIFDQCPFPLDR